MSSNRVILTVAAAALLAGAAAAVWSISRKSQSAQPEAAQELTFRQKSERVNATPSRPVARRPRRAAVKVQGDTRVRAEKPDFLVEAAELEKLSEEMRKMFFDLQNALDAGDSKRVYALVHKLQLMDEWPDGIPKAVKLKALNALAWFGASGMAEAVGFLSDSDSEIVDTALEKFEEMLMDWDIGDQGVSEILKQVVKVVHDRDALDSFFMELGNMRDTVRAETAIAIYDSGNADAIAVLNEGFEFAFDVEPGEDPRATVEKILAEAEKVYEENPEKRAEDEKFYGANKD